MRREYYIKKGGGDPYVDWLKSLGCVTYLPLSADGDLQDRITGLSLQLTGQGSMVYNATWGGHLVTTPSSTSQYVAKLHSDFNKNMFADYNLTALYTMQMVTNNSSKYIRHLSPHSFNKNTNTVFMGNYQGTGQTSRFPRTMVKIGTVRNYTNTLLYTNGLQTETYSPYSGYYPNAWQVISDGLILNPTPESNNCAVQYYLREAYIFNTALDLATIRKIQGYEKLAKLT